MQNKIKTDRNKRKIILKYFLKRKLLKSIILNNNLSKRIRFIASTKLNEITNNSLLIRAKNRCIISGKPRSVFRKFKLSRIVIKNLASFNLINGLRKSSY